MHISVHAASGRHAREPHAMHLHTRPHTHMYYCMCACDHATHLTVHTHVSCTHVCAHVCTLACSTRAHVLTPARACTRTCRGAPPPPQAAGWVRPNPVRSSPPGRFARLFSPRAPGYEPMCRCRPWPPGPGTCGSPGRKPLAPSSCRSPHPSKCVIGDPSPGASPTAQAGSEAPGRPPACPSVGPHRPLVPFDCGLSRTGHVFVPLPGARLAHGSQSELSEVRQRDRGTKGEVCTPPSRAPVQPPAGGGWKGPAEHRAAPSRPGRPWPLACGGRSC